MVNVAVTAVLVLSPLAGGASHQINSDEPTPVFTPMSYAPTLWAPARRDPPVPGNGLLAQILDRIGPTSIVAATLDAPPAWANSLPAAHPGDPPPAALPSTARWLNTTIAVPQLGPDVLRGLWEALLMEGALWDELYYSGGPSYLVNTSIRYQLPDGTIVDRHQGGMGNPAHGQRFKVETPAMAGVLAQIAENFGLGQVSVEILSPVQAAPAVVAVTHDPTAVVQNAAALRNALFGEPPLYEGYYLEIRDATTQRPIYIDAMSFRTAVGRTWIRPDLDPRMAYWGFDWKPPTSGNPG